MQSGVQPEPSIIAQAILASFTLAENAEFFVSVRCVNRVGLATSDSTDIMEIETAQRNPGEVRLIEHNPKPTFDLMLIFHRALLLSALSYSRSLTRNFSRSRALTPHSASPLHDRTSSLNHLI